MIKVQPGNAERSPALIMEELAGTHARVELAVEICGSPVCSCRGLQLVEQLGPASIARSAGASGTAPRRFALDPFAHTRAAQEDAETADAGSEALAERVAGALSSRQWDELREMFMAHKALAISEIDPGREPVSYPFEKVERDGLMISYRHSIPFDAPIIVSRAGVDLWLDELHCVAPWCHCHNASIALFERESGAMLHECEPRHEAAAFVLDHRCARWTDADTEQPPRGEALVLKELLLAQHPDVLQILAQQQRLLRRIYLASKAALYREPTAPTVPAMGAGKVGRNEPCPCGSGKKYKKCCLL